MRERYKTFWKELEKRLDTRHWSRKVRQDGTKKEYILALAIKNDAAAGRFTLLGGDSRDTGCWLADVTDDDLDSYEDEAVRYNDVLELVRAFAGALEGRGEGAGLHVEDASGGDLKLQVALSEDDVGSFRVKRVDTAGVPRELVEMVTPYFRFDDRGHGAKVATVRPESPVKQSGHGDSSKGSKKRSQPGILANPMGQRPRNAPITFGAGK